MDGEEAQSWLLSYPKYVSEKRLMQAYWWSGYGACISALLISKKRRNSLEMITTLTNLLKQANL
ncbi:hypothetical protein [Enterococcus casseliflavus]|uniref:hypothetical protein n=1 Tax=Enterococcus casseliflavus TaxID=37734 RepID=UPI0015E864DA|nr:hypothetical protein [Enterococcus casseliflavus]